MCKDLHMIATDGLIYFITIFLKVIFYNRKNDGKLKKDVKHLDTPTTHRHLLNVNTTHSRFAKVSCFVKNLGLTDVFSLV